MEVILLLSFSRTNHRLFSDFQLFLIQQFALFCSTCMLVEHFGMLLITHLLLNESHLLLFIYENRKHSDDGLFVIFNVMPERVCVG